MSVRDGAINWNDLLPGRPSGTMRVVLLKARVIVNLSSTRPSSFLILAVIQLPVKFEITYLDVGL